MNRKRWEEQEHLALFLRAYEGATNETFLEIEDSETPDFLAEDSAGLRVGIELTQLRFSPEEQFWRSIDKPDSADMDAYFRALELLSKKQSTLTKGNWHLCQRKILVVMLVDTTIEDLGFVTDLPEEGGFDEVWLADYSQVEAYGDVDIFALVHGELEGHFATGNRGQKPYG